MTITAIHALRAVQTFDATGYPALLVEVRTVAGQVAKAEMAVPVMRDLATGARLGEWQIADKKVVRAISIIEKIVAKRLRGVDARDQLSVDKRLKKIVSLPGWASFAISLAVMKLAARTHAKELFMYARDFAPFSGPGWQLPTPLVTLLSGMDKAVAGIGLEKIYISPNLKRSSEHRQYAEQLLMLGRIYRSFGQSLTRNGFGALVDSAGGYRAPVVHAEQLFVQIKQAISHAGYVLGKDVSLVLAVGATQFYHEESKRYRLEYDDHFLTADELFEVYRSWCKRWHVAGFIEPFASQDEKHWTRLLKTVGKHGLMVGQSEVQQKSLQNISRHQDRSVVARLAIDDFQTVTDLLSRAVTLSQNHAVRFWQRAGAETTETGVVDLAVACSAEYMAFGGFSRGECAEKYNRCLSISDQLAT